jgi:hypothetical protein
MYARRDANIRRRRTLQDVVSLYLELGAEVQRCQDVQAAHLAALLPESAEGVQVYAEMPDGSVAQLSIGWMYAPWVERKVRTYTHDMYSSPDALIATLGKCADEPLHKLALAGPWRDVVSYDEVKAAHARIVLFKSSRMNSLWQRMATVRERLIREFHAQLFDTKAYKNHDGREFVLYRVVVGNAVFTLHGNALYLKEPAVTVELSPTAYLAVQKDTVDPFRRRSAKDRVARRIAARKAEKE